VLPEAEPVLRAWLAVQTQWRVGMAGPTGLDYAGVEAALRLRDEDDRAGVFAGLQVCEAAMLEALRERREREQLGQLLSGGLRG
jgi:hypothetical protein